MWFKQWLKLMTATPSLDAASAYMTSDVSSKGERLVCSSCGAWLQIRLGDTTRICIQGFEPGSPEEEERLRLASHIDPFIERHLKCAGEGGIKIRREGDDDYLDVDPSKEEP